MWRIIVSTKDHLYFLEEEGHQFRVGKKGGLQVHSSSWCILKLKGTNHLKKNICKPGGTWIQKQHFLSLKKPGLILEERMWRIIVFTKDTLYCLVREGNQCRVEKKGGE